MEINKDVLKAHALLKLVELYGMQYMQSKIKDCWHGVHDAGAYCRFIYLFEGSKGESKNITDKKGWKVYAIIDVDKSTFATTVVESVLPNQ